MFIAVSSSPNKIARLSCIEEAFTGRSSDDDHAPLEEDKTEAEVVEEAGRAAEESRVECANGTDETLEEGEDALPAEKSVAKCSPEEQIVFAVAKEEACSSFAVAAAGVET